MESEGTSVVEERGKRRERGRRRGTDPFVASAMKCILISSTESISRIPIRHRPSGSQEHSASWNGNHNHDPTQLIATLLPSSHHAITRSTPTNRHTLHCQSPLPIPLLISFCTMSCRNAVSAILSLPSVNKSPMLSLLYLVILSIVCAQCWCPSILS